MENAKKKNIFSIFKEPKLIATFIINFVLSFMVFIYEPTVLFTSNSEDFWFAFGMMLKINILLFVIAFLFLSLFSIFIYYIGKKIGKKILFNIYLILLFSGLMILYVQGNYFSSKLPVLNGTPIDWNSFKIESIISIVLVVLAIAISVILYKKKNDIYPKIVSAVSVVIFVLLLTGLIPTIIQNKNVLGNNVKCTSTLKNMNNLSTNKNFLILMIDMVDSKTFDKVLKEENKEDLFKDFTYYPDTLSAYSYTMESIPFLMSGNWYDPNDNYYDYYNESFDNSPLLKRLKDEDYDINIYEPDIQWSSKKCAEVNNMSTSSYKINLLKFAKQEIKYVIFKYFPYPLKRFSKIQTMNFNLVRQNDFKANNSIVYEQLNDIKLQNKNYFQFYHTEGGHFPWDTDKNFNTIKDGTYEDKLKGSLRVVEKYIDRIKKSGQYDNSVIIVMADHGTNTEDIYSDNGRQNPALYIKGINEHHDSMIVSDKKVSHVDFIDSIYNDLLDGKTSEELLKDIGTERTRTHRWYKNFHYDKYYEQTTDGHAWETDKLNFTGTVYERKY